MGGVAKKQKTKLGCEKYFCRVTYWAQLEMLLLQVPTRQVCARKRLVRLVVWLPGPVQVYVPGFFPSLALHLLDLIKTRR
jgi:hypothetical protein